VVIFIPFACGRYDVRFFFLGYLVVRRGPTDIMCQFFVVIMFDALLDMLGHL
jgi:hypothetical protein